jgi:hypothetical protein
MRWLFRHQDETGDQSDRESAKNGRVQYAEARNPIILKWSLSIGTTSRSVFHQILDLSMPRDSVGFTWLAMRKTVAFSFY